MPLKRFLELFGLPTTNKQGHEIGCACEECMAARARARTEPFEPGTVGYVIQEAMRTTDADPYAFACPACGERMAVTYVDGKADIFHRKPTCRSFEARGHDYRQEVLRLGASARKESR